MAGKICAKFRFVGLCSSLLMLYSLQVIDYGAGHTELHHLQPKLHDTANAHKFKVILNNLLCFA